LHKYLHSSDPGVLETEIDIGAFDESGEVGRWGRK